MKIITARCKRTYLLVATYNEFSSVICTIIIKHIHINNIVFSNRALDALIDTIGFPISKWLFTRVRL